jgi:hypothetical protein
MRPRRVLALIVAVAALVALAGQGLADTPTSPLEVRPAAVTVSWEKLAAVSAEKPLLLPNELLNDGGRQWTVSFGVSSLTASNGQSLCASCLHAAIANPLTPGGHRPIKMWVDEPPPTMPKTSTKPPPASAGQNPNKTKPSKHSTKTLPASELPAGSYSGTLVAYVEQSDAGVRVPLTITVGTATVAAAPLVESVKATVHCYVPSFIAAWTPLGHHCSHGTTMWIPLKADVDPGPKAAKLALATGPVGSLAGDNGSAVVNYDGGKVKDVATGKAIPVSIVGLTHPGEYQGKIDLVADPEDKVGLVTLKATLSDAWGWAVAMIVLGTLAALGLLRYSGQKRTAFNLNLRRWDARDAIDKVKANLVASEKPWAGVDIEEGVKAKSDEISAKIKELGNLSFSDADVKKVAEIEAGVAALTAAAANLDELGKLLPKLELARDTLSHRAAPLPATDPVHTGAPPLANEATKLLAPKELTLDALNALVTIKVPDMVKLIADWQSREADIADSEGKLEAIERDKLSPDGRKTLDAAFECLSSIWNRLWVVTSEAEFDSEEIDKDRAHVHRVLADLHGVPHKPQIPPMLGYARQRTMALMPDWSNLVLADLVRADLAVGGGAGGTAAQPTPVRPKPPPTEETIKRLRSEGLKRELILLALGFVIALFTALNALYMGKAWGTWFDYGQALLWALTTAGVLALILVPTLDQLAKLRPLGKLIQR